MASSLLVLIWLFSWCGLGACRARHDKTKFTKNGIHEYPIAFLVLEVYRFVSFREVLHFPTWFYPTLLDYDVFLYILVKLVVTILTSLRSSKTESGCESYARFRFALSAVFQRGGSSGPSTGSSGPCFHLSFFG